MAIAKPVPGITQIFLKQLFIYDPYTVIIIRNIDRNGGFKKGDIAGTISDQGYRKINIFGKPRRATALIWLYMTGEWPSGQVDHINGIRNDDRWVNLRLATHSQNNANKNINKPWGSGYLGVGKFRNKWRAYTKKDGKNYHIGLYNTREEALEAYKLKKQELFGDFFGRSA